MIEQKNLFRVTVMVVLISLFFGVMSFLQIPFQYYLWEILIDLKAASLLVIFFFFFRKNELALSTDQLTVLVFDWKRNVVLFFIPILFYSMTIGIGYLFSDVKSNAMENAVTLILATLFDIPAIYVFSATSVLIEELVFRGILIKSFERSFGIPKSVILGGFLWMIYMVSDIVGTEKFDYVLSGTLVLFFLSVGSFLSALSLWKGNVWLGYSLRIGLITLTPVILTSQLIESDSFFVTESMFFFAEGICFSVITGSIAWIMTIRSEKIRLEPQKLNIS